MLNIDAIQERLKHRFIYGGILHNQPTPIKGQAEPELILFEQHLTIPPRFSVVVPVFNQDAIIERTIRSIMATMEGPYELIIILDGCVDRTESLLLTLLSSSAPSLLTRSILIRQKTPVYETTCDNIGFLVSSGPYILEIQADMEMTEYGFNTNLSRGLKDYDDIIGVSGRCSHGFGSPIGVGKLGELIEAPLDPELDRNTMYLYGTCNRGPLLLDHQKLKALNYLDERNYFHLDSDHDLFARALVMQGWRCGYIPMEFRSPLKDGSARRTNTDPRIQALNAEVHQIKSQRPNHGFLKTMVDREPPIIETRPLQGHWQRTVPSSLQQS